MPCIHDTLKNLVGRKVILFSGRICDIFSEIMDGRPKNWRDKTVSLTAMEQIQSLWVLIGRPGNKSVLESPESQAWL